MAATKGAATEEKGYFATLGVDFHADSDAISRAYKKLALKMHPDKNPGPAAVDNFQKITTSYHVISDEQKRKNYLHLFMLRCYMSQVPPRSRDALRPHYAFVVEKSKYAMGSKSDRLITIDLLEQKLHSFKKDTHRKEFALSTVASVHTSDGSGSKALELTITFKDTHPYYIRCRCQEQFDTLVAVLRRVVAAKDSGEQGLDVVIDDASSPPSSVHKSKVIKRTEKMGAALVHDWQPRFMVMGTTQLVIFRDVELQQLVNIVPLSLIRLTPDARDSTCFQLSTSFWKASFRVLTSDVAGRWQSALIEQQQAAARGQSRRTRVSVIFTDQDVSDLHRGAPSCELQPVAEDLLALPPPPLAKADAALSGGWLQYTDDLGNRYFYNASSNQTTWELPDGVQIPFGEADSAAATAGDTSPLSARVEADDVREAQMAALNDDTNHGSVPSPQAISEAKDRLVSMMLSMERGLSRARRGVEANRPLHDLGPIIEQLRGSFEKMTAFGAEYERQWLQRDAYQQSFMQSKAAYLDGLQTHMLGDGEPGSDSVAGKIFRKCAVVADTFNPRTTALRTVL